MREKREWVYVYEREVIRYFDFAPSTHRLYSRCPFFIHAIRSFLSSPQYAPGAAMSIIPPPLRGDLAGAVAGMREAPRKYLLCNVR